MRKPNPLKSNFGRFSKVALVTLTAASSLMMGGCATMQNSDNTHISANADVPFNGQYSTPNNKQSAIAQKLRRQLQQGQLNKITQVLATQGAFNLIGQKQPDIYDPYQEAAFKARTNGSYQAVADATFNHHLNRNMMHANPDLSLEQIKNKLQVAFTGPFEVVVPLQLLSAGVNPLMVSQIAGQSLETLNINLNEALANFELNSPYQPQEPTFWQTVKKSFMGQPNPQKVIQGIN